MTPAQPTPNKPRLHYIDFMKGLCIILIVIHHENEHIFDLLGNHFNYTLESFRMPMYYFISGIFFKRYDGLGDFVRRKVNNIVVPLCFFYLLSCLVVGVVSVVPVLQRGFPEFEWSFLSDPLTSRLWRANVPMWFLLSLMEVNLLCYALQWVSHRRWWLVIASLALSLGGYWLSWHHIKPPLLLDTALLGVPYFLLGTLVRRQGWLTPSPADRWGWVVLVAVLAAIYPLAQELSLWKQVMPNYLYLYLAPACAMVSLTWACKRLSYVPIICYIGRYSLVVLCTHIVVMTLVERAVWHFTVPPVGASAVIIIFILLIELPLIKAFTTLLPRFTAQAPLFDKGWRLRCTFFGDRGRNIAKK